MKKVALIILVLTVLNGCAISPPFNNRVDYMTLKQMQKIDSLVENITLVWAPSDFPNQIEIKGASGFRGSAAQVRVPTGPSISSRLTEALDQVVEVQENSDNIVFININEVESNFKFIAGILNQDPAIDWGEVIADITFEYKGTMWTEKFHFVESDPQIDGSSLTKPLEDAWDKTALAMAKSIVTNINKVESLR
ncbi:hypothetical protein [Vibrio metschnikovii]|uniref:hypothetical protein n=1 Tax=Vibrio metschnikovii TaxID=28172 RepID=UPI001C307E83|nr:hypothetical protein [Vibrio metschnikovii]